MKTAQWIWYPSDFELMLAWRMMTKRFYREVPQPPIWRMDDFWKCIKFAKAFTLEADDEIEIFADGMFNLELDVPGKFVRDFGGTLRLSKGAHTLCVQVCQSERLPALFVRGRELVSDESWNVTCHDGNWLPAACWNFTDPGQLPHDFKLAERRIFPVGTEKTKDGTLLDFGKESFGRVVLEHVKGDGTATFFFGESRAEALDTANCEQTDVAETVSGNLTHPVTKAFRYVFVRPEGIRFDRASALSEYLPLERKSRFFCNDELVNRIWDVSYDTFELCSREFFVDGIKRDRWVWSGDATQSYLMNYYSFFDNNLVRRTTAALRGKEPVTQHINTIMDYSFYWLIGLSDYLEFTGDATFIERYWDRAESLLRFCLGRRNADGFLDKREGDWVFVDWSEGIDNEGEVCCEQMLLSESLKRMADLAEFLGKKEVAEEFSADAARLDAAIEETFWDEEAGAYRYSRRNGKVFPVILKHPNLFAVKFGFCKGNRRERILKNIFENPGVLPITTPYMRFYESEMLCQAGRHREVLGQMREYWGGMLSEGATSFWELYRPGETGAEHYAMYDRPYGRSLCHAWGASPLYLLGRFFAGVEPAQRGYRTFAASPHLGGLGFFESEIPTATGSVRIRMDETSIELRAEGVSGELNANDEFEFCGEFAGRYRLGIEPGRDYRIPIQIKKNKE